MGPGRALIVVLAVGGLLVANPSGDAQARSLRAARHAASATPTVSSPTRPWTNECWSTDRGDPVLVGLSVDHPVVDTSLTDVTQTFRVVAADTGGPGPATGLAKVEVSYAITDPDQSGPIPLARLSDGTWAGTRFFPRDAYQAGPRPLTTVVLTDRAGNVRVLRRTELVAAGHDVTFTLVHDGVDQTPPVLVELAVSPTGKVSTDRRGHTVTVRAHLQDDTAVTEVELILNREPKGYLTLVQGDHADGWWQIRFRIPRGTSEAYLVELFGDDSAGHSPFFDYRYLEQRHQRYRIAAVSHVVDNDDPALAKLVVRPATLDLRTRDTTATVTVDATDPTSGLISAIAFMHGPRAWRVATTPLHRVSGSRLASRWTARVRLPHCGASAGRYQVWVTVYDGVGRSGTVRRFVKVRSLDRRRPRVEVRGVEAGNDPLRLTFDEGVTGLDPSTVPVIAHDNGDVYSPGPAVEGAWTCRNGRAVVDCASGVLRTAAFTPARGWTVGVGYSVDLAPNGTAGVHDLAGNPVAEPLTSPRSMPEI
jgi:hypothetical protein